MDTDDSMSTSSKTSSVGGWTRKPKSNNGILLVGRKPKQKKVGWAPEERLFCTRYFEMDETERGGI